MNAESCEDCEDVYLNKVFKLNKSMSFKNLGAEETLTCLVKNIISMELCTMIFITMFRIFRYILKYSFENPWKYLN